MTKSLRARGLTLTDAHDYEGIRTDTIGYSRGGCYEMGPTRGRHVVDTW